MKSQIKTEYRNDERNNETNDIFYRQAHSTSNEQQTTIRIFNFKTHGKFKRANAIAVLNRRKAFGNMLYRYSNTAVISLKFFYAVAKGNAAIGVVAF